MSANGKTLAAMKSLEHGMADQQILFINSHSQRFAAATGTNTAGGRAISSIRPDIENRTATLPAGEKSRATTKPETQPPARAGCQRGRAGVIERAVVTLQRGELTIRAAVIALPVGTLRIKKPTTGAIILLTAGG